MAVKYSEKLKDPRWQKKRLEIFDRDDWTCQSCGNREGMLSAHHRIYLRGCNPWDYPRQLLVTLFSDCHNQERELRSDAEQRLLETLRETRLWWDVQSLGDALFNVLPSSDLESTLAQAIQHIKSERDYLGSQSP